MNIWHDIDSNRINENDFISVIEIPRGSKTKYEVDKETGVLMLDRILSTSTQYPLNYGFIPKTLSGDGDPLDVLVLCSETLYPLSIVRCYPIGIINMLDNNKTDEKIIAIPYNDPFYNEYKDISDLPTHLTQEIVHFLSVYKALEPTKTNVDSMNNRSEAVKVILQAKELYKNTFKK